MIGFAVLLAGCTGTTYGTGRSTGVQTLQDLAGLGGLSNEKKEPIDYSARPPVVNPPTGSAALPPPRSNGNVVTAANWPDDPDERRARFLAEQESRRTAVAYDDDYKPLNKYDPKFRLPSSEQQRPRWDRSDLSPSERARGSREEDERARKAFAAAEGNASVDADGNPIRRYLTEPPVEYRQPDPNAPVQVANEECERKFRWPWQRPKPGECTPG